MALIKNIFFIKYGPYKNGPYEKMVLIKNCPYRNMDLGIIFQDPARILEQCSMCVMMAHVVTSTSIFNFLKNLDDFRVHLGWDGVQRPWVPWVTCALENSFKSRTSDPEMPQLVVMGPHSLEMGIPGRISSSSSKARWPQRGWRI